MIKLVEGKIGEGMNYNEMKKLNEKELKKFIKNVSKNAVCTEPKKGKDETFWGKIYF